MRKIIVAAAGLVALCAGVYLLYFELTLAIHPRVGLIVAGGFLGFLGAALLWEGVIASPKS